jgi:hypothetical protein
VLPASSSSPCLKLTETPFTLILTISSVAKVLVGTPAAFVVIGNTTVCVSLTAFTILDTTASNLATTA